MIARWPSSNRPCGTGRPFESNPGLASWAKFSRPFGTQFADPGSSHTLWRPDCSRALTQGIKACLGRNRPRRDPVHLLAVPAGLVVLSNPTQDWRPGLSSAVPSGLNSLILVFAHAVAARLKSCIDTKHQSRASAEIRAFCGFGSIFICRETNLSGGSRLNQIERKVLLRCRRNAACRAVCTCGGSVVR
jgi:hypothetical protein